MHAVVAEVFAHGAAGVRGEELQRRRVGRGGGDDDGVFQRAVLLQRADELGDGRALLADGDVNAIELRTLVGAGMGVFLVDDGVDDDGGLAGLAVADDELALAAADRDQGVDRLEPGLHRLVDGFARDDARRLHLDPAAGDVGERALAVDRLAEAVHHAAEQAAADGDVDDVAGAGDGVALADAGVVAEHDDADVVALEVERHALDAGRGELDELAGHDVLQAEDAGDAVADREDLAGLSDVLLGVEGSDLLLEDVRDFGGADFHLAPRH